MIRLAIIFDLLALTAGLPRRKPGRRLAAPEAKPRSDDPGFRPTPITEQL